MGRPKLSEKDRKGRSKTFKCKQVEFNEIEMYCHEKKLSILDLVKLGMNKKIKAKPFPEAKALKVQLIRIGNLLNQETRAIQSSSRSMKLLALKRTKNLEELKKLYIEILDKLK